ncbi:MAG: hypothetical protein NTW85_15055 [Methylococcales bacterium]|nr:hypothetical protein [Methylococcales bacterium]
MLDNLTHIKGIGLAREKWLNEKGIASYEELAKTDPNWICEQLKTDGKPLVLLEVVIRWIEEASALAIIVTSLSESENDNALTEDGWDEFASFYVSYQYKQQVLQHSPLRTRVIYRTYADHIEANEDQQWNGIEGESLCHWIMDHVDKIISGESPKDETTVVQSVLTKQKSESCQLVIDSIEVQDATGEIISSKTGASFFQKVLSSEHPLIITPVLSATQANEEAFAWKGTLILYISKMPRDRSTQESQQQVLNFSSITDVQHRHSFQPVCLPVGLYCIQIILWTAEPSRTLAASKEYILQLV